jgi:AAA15 family ATPase/GTPase
MLTYFSVTNFRSIDSTVELNFLANNRLRHHKGHVKRPINDEKAKGVLKPLVLYGANAAGKSNIFKAIAHAKKLICGQYQQGKNLKQEPFRLKKENKEKPSEFYFEFSLNGLKTSYCFEYLNDSILKEELCVYKGKTKYTTVFKRKVVDGKNEIDSDLTIGSSLEKYIRDEIKSNDKEEDLEQLLATFEVSSAMKRTPKDKLILSELATRNFSEFDDKQVVVKIIGETFEYFLKKIVVIFPTSQYLGVRNHISSKDDSSFFIENFLSYDTGVNNLVKTPFSLSNLDEDYISNMEKSLKDDNRKSDLVRIDGKYVTFYLNDNQELSAEIVRTTHKDVEGNEIHFEVFEESDGTIRLLDLLPAICNNHETEYRSGVTYFIDEFNRSLHPSAAKQFIQQFIENSKHNNCQIVVSTHESELLDFSIIRRDEIYFVQKEKDYSTRLYSLDDYSTRFDRDIRKAYLSGRFGAIPMLTASR